MAGPASYICEFCEMMYTQPDKAFCTILDLYVLVYPADTEPYCPIS